MPFQKGQSGNPKGRPKGAMSVDELWHIVKEVDKEDGKDFIRDYIRAARNNPSMAKELFDRICAKIEKVDLTSDGEQLMNNIINIITEEGGNGRDAEHKGETVSTRFSIQ